MNRYSPETWLPRDPHCRLIELQTTATPSRDTLVMIEARSIEAMRRQIAAIRVVPDLVFVDFDGITFDGRRFECIGRIA